ncbi:lipid A biosynthesis acyltransferase [Alkalilimnicola sp. S0819]|uniref:LpxL/LpxP family acyltransferase n=1 Tax=Alkalilimnicola sp. S0819 TaxID=2613922 RepID=UPI0012617704|nr:lipid A biosynthesis acyltransferase [Alkalilimnicola sp. S0819]KAB7624179.1 lipid A biosynthesis acyltransferase [Alkalilimnicola sp. S0819]MPQ16433.1 lipid A biosynthesis acyltransferase [Alkalilimnicola sp. S0819]
MARSWQEHGERGTRGALRLILWIALRLGRPPARLLLYPISLYFLLTAPRTRAASRSFLRRALGREPSLRDVFRHIHHFAANVLDRVFFLADRWRGFKVRFHGLEQLDETLARGEGGVLLGAHLGSFEVLRTLAVRDRHVPLKVLMYRDHNQTITQLLDSLNPQVADTVIPLGETNALLRAAEFVQEGGLLGILADRIAANDKQLHCPFFGEPTAFPAGPVWLAAATHAPVLCFFGIYRGGRRYDIHFELLAPAYRGPRAEREAWMQQTMARYAARLEHYARRYPYNWFNFYDYWHETENGQAPR